ncbi:hypothetical protein B0H13DRAFT_1897168 [Mycena leptocephala]|nr:hypothetical protein B0H13DRAFT_1897168 [Mycena leptocephala]
MPVAETHAAESETPREERNTQDRNVVLCMKAGDRRRYGGGITVTLTDVPGANERGGAIALQLAPEVEPDADADADQADTDEEGLGVNEAEERLVGVAAAVWNCFRRTWRRRIRRGRRSGETGKRRCSYGLGAREGAIVG